MQSWGAIPCDGRLHHLGNSVYLAIGCYRALKVMGRLFFRVDGAYACPDKFLCSYLRPVLQNRYGIRQDGQQVIVCVYALILQDDMIASKSVGFNKQRHLTIYSKPHRLQWDDAACRVYTS